MGLMWEMWLLKHLTNLPLYPLCCFSYYLNPDFPLSPVASSPCKNGFPQLCHLEGH